MRVPGSYKFLGLSNELLFGDVMWVYASSTKISMLSKVSSTNSMCIISLRMCGESWRSLLRSPNWGESSPGSALWSIICGGVLRPVMATRTCLWRNGCPSPTTCVMSTCTRITPCTGPVHMGLPKDTELRRTKWLARDSREMEALEKVVFHKNFLRDIRQLANLCHTGNYLSNIQLIGPREIHCQTSNIRRTLLVN